jgi:hypothetical protein
VAGESTVHYLLNIAFEGLVYDALKSFVGPIIVTGVIAFGMRKYFDKLKTWKEVAYFSLACFIAVFVLMNMNNAKTSAPQLAGSIQTVILGPVSPSDPHDTVAVLTMSIVNTGTMQSAAMGWHVQASVNGSKYDANLLNPIPPTFTFTMPNHGASTPVAMIYHSEDNLVDKTVTPIQPGALVTGVLFVIFKGVDADVFKEGASYIVSYQDVFSRKYEIPGKTNAKFSVGTAPGLHTNAVCPIPPGGFPKAN